MNVSKGKSELPSNYLIPGAKALVSMKKKNQNNTVFVLESIKFNCFSIFGVLQETMRTPRQACYALYK